MPELIDEDNNEINSGVVLANLIIGSNGATTLAGSSKGLSFKADRIRFHQLRSRVCAVVIGGNTYRNEPYRSEQKVPLVVATRHADYGPGAGANFVNLSPNETVALALRDFGSPILVEGGIRFLEELLGNGVISTLFITRSNAAGDDHFFDAKNLLSRYQLESSEIEAGGGFEVWRLIHQLKS